MRRLKKSLRLRWGQHLPVRAIAQFIGTSQQLHLCRCG